MINHFPFTPTLATKKWILTDWFLVPVVILNGFALHIAGQSCGWVALLPLTKPVPQWSSFEELAIGPQMLSTLYSKN